jgi:hypothetical protein
MVLQLAMSQIGTPILNLLNSSHYYSGDLLVALTIYSIHGRV